jgi:5'-nucleotidase
LKQAFWGTGAISLGLIPEELFASSGLIKLTIVHTNDMHCHIEPFPTTDAEYPGQGGMVRIASMVEEFRHENPNLLLLDAGDMFQGTPYFNYYKGNLMVEVMNKMGYNAGTIGNHEFDNGLGDIQSAIKVANFPLISSNYDFSETILAGQVQSHKILKRDGIKIGIYGLGIELDGLVSRANFGKTRYLDPVAAALKMEEMLNKEYRCDLVICLSHLGYSYKDNKISDSALAPQTRYTDLIIGGHTHTFLKKPVEINNANGKPVVVNQAGWAALELGKIDFIFDHNRKLIGHLPLIHHSQA